MTYWYRAHGLVISSPVHLSLPEGPPGPPDLLLRRGADRPVPAQPAEGVQLAELRDPGGKVFYRLTRNSDGALLRYPGLCDFSGNRDLSEVTAHLQPGADPGVLAALTAGTVLAVHLMLRQRLVLHGSAVRRDGHAIAFVGASGMGKSTLAAALCGNGCDLIADDVLHVDSSMCVHPGGTETRLRIGEPLPLAACVVPRPNREAAEVSVRRLAPGRALLRMSRFPRRLGWTDPSSMSHTFQALADLVAAVPAFEATVPWGPPFRPEVLSGLLAAVA